MPEPILEFEDVTLSYGFATAVFGLSLKINPGETVGVLGRNGAGKTTTIRGAIGNEVSRRGRISFCGRDITAERSDRIARSGIGWVPDDRRIYPSLTVRENLFLASRGNRAERRKALDAAVEAVPLVGKLLDRKGSQLSGGEQQAVAIARALAGRPRLLLLDEPSEGLAPIIVSSLKSSIGELQRSGLSILLAEQNLQFVLALSQRVYVLESGRLVLEATAEEFRNSPEMQNRYLAIDAKIQERSQPDA